MADEFLPPVVARLVADIAPYVAGLTEAQARMDLFVEAQTVAMAKVDSRMAAMGAGGGGMGVGMRAEATAANAAATEVVAANDRIALSAAKTAESGTLAAMQWEVDYEKMAAATTKATLEMEAANRQAIASTEAMATKIDAAAASSAATTAGKMKLVKEAAAGIGLVGVTVAAVTAKMAGDFEQSTNKLVTSAGETEHGLQIVRQGMLAMAGEVGVSAGHLSDAMYKIESAGYHAEAGLGVLKAAEQGAKAEGADGVRVADALSSALRDYYPHAQSAADVTKVSADVMSKLIGATSAGKMTFDQLAGSLNSILPVSSAANITLTDTLGVLASMTVHGISAEQATQNMADAIRHLQAPTAVMSKAMATLGIDSIDVAQKLGERGLSGTMQMLSERVKAAMPPGTNKVILDLGDALSKSTPKVQELGQKLLEGTITMAGFSKEAKALDPLSAKQAASFSTLAGSYHQLGTQQISGAEVMQSYGGMMQKVMGDATGLKVALMTTGENAQYTNDAIKTISGSTADAAGNVKGWSEVQNTFNQHMSQAKAALGALAITVGTQLLPAFSKVMGVFADVVGWLAKHKVAAEILAAVVGGALVVAFSALLAVFWGFAANPVTWIIAGIVVALLALGTAVYMVITHWGAVTRFFQEWGPLILTTIMPFVGIPLLIAQHWGAIKHFFSDLWRDTEHIFSAAIHATVGFAKEWGPLILTAIFPVLGIPLLIMQHWGAIKHFFSDLWGGIVSFFESVPGKIGHALDSLDNTLSKLAVDGWNGFTHGLEVAFRATLYFLDRLPHWFFTSLGFLAGLLGRLAIDGWNGFTHGIETAYTATVRFFTDLPGNINKFMTGSGNWIDKHGESLMDGMSRGIEKGYKATERFFLDLPGKIKGFVMDAHNWIVRHGVELVEGFGRGISEAWNATARFFWELPGVIGRFFGGVWDWLVGHGRDLINGLGRGIGDAWDAVAKWFWDLPGNIGRFFDDAGNWLVEAGKNIVYGIWHGITAAGGWLWNKVKSFGSDIVNGFNAGIQSNSPSLLAAQSGMYFVQGVGMGIDNHAHIALTAAKTLARGVVGAMSGMSGTATLGVAGGGSLGFSGGGGPTVVHVHVNVEGSVHSVASLREAVQDAVLQHKFRNATNGLG